MPTVSRRSYEAMTQEMIHDLQVTVAAYSARHDLVYDPASLARQSSCTGDLVREILGFGMNVWPDDLEDDGEATNWNEIEVDPTGSDVDQVPFATPHRFMRFSLALAACLILIFASTADFPNRVEAHALANNIAYGPYDDIFLQPPSLDG